ncbi:MAG: leucine-rich repeat domain-containing protein [Planctomycetota bacterium]
MPASITSLPSLFSFVTRKRRPARRRRGIFNAQFDGQDRSLSMPTVQLGCDILEQRIVLTAAAAIDSSFFEFTAGTITSYQGAAAKVVIPATINGTPVKEIAGSAFANHTEITSLVIPGSVTNIDNNAFSGLTHLTNVQFGTGLTSIGDSAFRDASLLKEVKFPNSLISIGDNAFRHSGLQGVTFGKNVGSIGVSAFADNTAMMKSVIPGNVKLISAGAFQGNVSLKVLQIGKGVATIGDSAFAGIKALRAVSIPGTVKTIGSEAFAGDTAIQYVGFGRGIQSIGRSAFAGNTALQTVVIPGTVKTIGDGAFRGDTALARAVIRHGVETIGDNAFQDNIAMTGVLIPHSVKVIGDSAFEGNVAMAGVVIGNGVHTIGNRAFYGCTALTSVVLGKGVEVIGTDAFASGLNESSLPRTYYVKAPPVRPTMYESAGMIVVPQQGPTNYFYSDKVIEGVPFVKLTAPMMAKKTSLITAQHAKADSRRAALAERVGQVAVRDSLTSRPTDSVPNAGSGYDVYFMVSCGSSSSTKNVSATTTQFSDGDSWSFEMPEGDTWNHVISNFTGPSTATSGTSRLVIQTDQTFGPRVSGYSTTPTGTYNWTFSNATTGALYTIHFTVS